VLGPGHGPK